MKKKNETDYQEKRQRITDLISLKRPDRVPIWFQDASFFPAKYTGITAKETMYEADKAIGAYKKAILDFEPDLVFNPAFMLHSPGEAVEVMDCRQVVLPGQKGVSENASFQYVEAEYMKQNEYDEFLSDITGFVIYKYLPRLYGALKPLASLPPLAGLLVGYAGLPMTPAFIGSDILTALDSFLRSAHMVGEHSDKVGAFCTEIAQLGFPIMCGGATLTPFDVIGDFLRGMRGVLTDMYRCPDKLLAAMERITPMMINSAIAGCRMTGNPSVFIALHRGADGFMSLEQFETFYWPGLKKLLLALIDAGLTPCPFFEGDYTERLEYLAQLPKGKILGFFDRTDIFKAKEIIGKTMAMSGFMPVSLLQTGTPEAVKDYAKNLIDVLGKDGGYIMGPSSAMDEAKPELVKVWFDFTKTYGVYS
jgi:uroporphyrinogen-III decarboxylase